MLHAPMQVAFWSVKPRSLVVSSSPESPRASRAESRSLSAPLMWQAAPQQTVIVFFPTGLVRNFG